MIRVATRDDISRIAEIQIAGWRYAYRGIISDYELFSERQVSKSIQATITRFDSNCAYLVYEDMNDKIIKGFAWHGPSRDDDKKSAYEVVAFYVQPEFTRNGIGQLLVDHLSDIAKSNQCTELFAWVLEGNEKGISFYKKNGFIDDGKRKHIEKWNKEEIRMIKGL